jgi:hypothetical protein
MNEASAVETDFADLFRLIVHGKLTLEGSRLEIGKGAQVEYLLGR